MAIEPSSFVSLLILFQPCDGTCMVHICPFHIVRFVYLSSNVLCSGQEKSVGLGGRQSRSQLVNSVSGLVLKLCNLWNSLPEFYVRILLLLLTIVSFGAPLQAPVL